MKNYKKEKLKDRITAWILENIFRVDFSQFGPPGEFDATGGIIPLDLPDRSTTKANE